MFDKYFSTNLEFSWEQAAATSIALVFVCATALFLHRVLFGILRRIAKMSATPVDGMVFDQLYRPLIPTCIDHNPWAHLRCPMVMMCQG